MTRATPYLTLAAGALFVLVPPVVALWWSDAFALMGLAALLVLAALPGLHRLQRGADGRAGTWGVRLTVAGLAALIVVVLSGDLLDAAVDGGAQAVVEAAYLLVGGAAALAVLGGSILFVVGLARGRVLPAWAGWLFLGGMVLALTSELVEQSLRGPVPWLADTLPPLGFVVAGFGLLSLGRAASALDPGAPVHHPAHREVGVEDDQVGMPAGS